MAAIMPVPQLPQTDEVYMSCALAQAREALSHGEIPVGCVLVDRDGRMVAYGHNLTETLHDPSAHAEIVTLRRAGAALGSGRLPGLTMFVTLEPCCMCAGALIHARLARLCYGTADPRTGACGSVFSIISDPRHNHHLEVHGGVMAGECGALLRDFFRKRREEMSRGISHFSVTDTGIS